MTTILTLAVIIVGATVLYNLWLFDCLARWEYEHHREQWERDGKPSGFLTWRPKEPKSWSSGRVEQHLNMKWTFKTPGWASASPECRHWIIQTHHFVGSGSGHCGRVARNLFSMVVVHILQRTLFSLLEQGADVTSPIPDGTPYV